MQDTPAYRRFIGAVRQSSKCFRHCRVRAFDPLMVALIADQGVEQALSLLRTQNFAAAEKELLKVLKK